jgi:uncharacterized protein (TIGR02246 family)
MSELNEVVNRFRDAWNAHDADALARMWTEDGELNHPWGFHAVGRTAVRKLLAEEHAGSMAASRIESVEISKAEEGSEKCIADLALVLSGVRAPHGKTYELRPSLSTMFVRSGGEWLIRSMTPVAQPR